ncbi:MAG: protein-glutamine glutaminase family protein [Bacteriovoracaceae bacterium]
MKLVFVFISLLILSFESTAQDIEVEKLFSYYQRTLPQHYLKSLRLIKVEGFGSKRMEELEILLKNSSSPDDLILCLSDKYNHVSVTELQSILLKMTDYLAKNSKRLSCRHKKEFISKSELNQTYSKLLNNNLYKNDFPNGNCFDRAYLISKDFDDLGFKSEQLLINDHSVAAFKTSSGYIAESYPVHIANVITVKDAHEMKKYVIDPMYFDQPVTIEEYKRVVFINPESKNYSIERQDYNYNNDIKEECSFSEFRLEEARQNILASQENKPKGRLFSTYTNAEDAISNFRKKFKFD